MWQADSKKSYGKEQSVANRKVYYKHYPGSRQVVIFIHGIIEGPKQFRNLAKMAYEEGNSIYILLLPGHGGSGEKFAKTNFKQWMAYVSDEIKRMRRRYDGIILVGHSMGALFCICETASNSRKIRQLVLIDTPLKIHVWPRVMRGAIKIIFHKVKSQESYVISEYRAMSVMPVTNGISLKYVSWLKRYMELFAIIKYARKQLPLVKVPAFIIFAKKDEFVSIKSERYFDQLNSPVIKLHLSDSGHFCYHHSDLLALERYFRMIVGQNTKEIYSGRQQGREKI